MMKRKNLILFALLFLTPSLARGQGMRWDNFVLKMTPSNGMVPVSGALITVCTSAGTGTPCTPKVANIYSDEALTVPITGTGGAGTTNSDANGNFGFYAAPGSYIVTVTGSGFTGYTIKLVLPVGNATGITESGPATFNSQIVSTIATGTAPFSITSTTPVANLAVNNIGAVAVSGTAAAGKQIIATSGTAAAWNTGFNPSGGYSVNDCLQVGGGTSVNLIDAGYDCGHVNGQVQCANVTPVTLPGTSTTNDQNLQSCVIGTLANVVGRTLHIRMAGVYTTAASSTAAITIKLKLCTINGCGSGTVLAPINIQTAALATISAVNNPFNVDADITVQTAGASSAYEAHGTLIINMKATVAQQPEDAYNDTNTTTVGTIDGTNQIFLQGTIAFSAASASNVATGRQLLGTTVN